MNVLPQCLKPERMLLWSLIAIMVISIWVLLLFFLYSCWWWAKGKFKWKIFQSRSWNSQFGHLSISDHSIICPHSARLCVHYRIENRLKADFRYEKNLNVNEEIKTLLQNERRLILIKIKMATSIKEWQKKLHCIKRPEKKSPSRRQISRATYKITENTLS